jgi:Putative prokaryotic signal transducing protein
MASKPQPDQELVEVFDTDQESEAMVVRGLLESAGIDTIQTGLDAPQDILPGVGGVVLRVPVSQADAARHLIEEYRAGGTAAAEEGEINSEDPSAQ